MGQKPSGMDKVWIKEGKNDKPLLTKALIGATVAFAGIRVLSKVVTQDNAYLEMLKDLTKDISTEDANKAIIGLSAVYKLP